MWSAEPLGDRGSDISSGQHAHGENRGCSRRLRVALVDVDRVEVARGTRVTNDVAARDGSVYELVQGRSGLDTFERPPLVSVLLRLHGVSFLRPHDPGSFDVSISV